jgi:GT2 family glycosyltransferase
MSLYNAHERYLAEAIESVKKQEYKNWELCICDDGYTIPDVKKILRHASMSSRKIKVKFLTSNRGITAATNTALSLADGEYVGFLDHHDILYPDALFEVVKLINEDRNVDYIYTDEDKISHQGSRRDPSFKPDWSPDLLLSVNYATHFSVFRTSLLRTIGGLRNGFDGSQDYDLLLRATEKAQRIAHLRKAIYGRRIPLTSTTGSEPVSLCAYASAVKALQEAMTRRGIKAQVEALPNYRYHVKYEIEGTPLVTIIIPTRTTKYITNCVMSILEKTKYEKYEVLVVDNGTGMDLSKVLLDPSEKLRFIVNSSDFNWSRMNNQAAKLAKGEYLVFLNDDTEVISGEWLSAMLEHAQREEVGAVGAKLLHADGTVQHAGIIIGVRGAAANYEGIHASDPGYLAFASMIRNCSAVTGACMMVRKNYFMKMGGFDESLGHSWNDVDFGIRIVQSGRWIIYTPYALLYHYVGGTRGKHDKSSDEMKARDLFKKKNADFIRSGDPFYNPNLSTDIPYLPAYQCNVELYKRLRKLRKTQSA